jgi:hypothetical protein
MLRLTDRHPSDARTVFNMLPPPTGLDLRSSSPTISIERCFEFRVALAARSLAPSLDAPDDDAVPVTTAGVAGGAPGPARPALTTGQTSPALSTVITTGREVHVQSGQAYAEEAAAAGQSEEVGAADGWLIFTMSGRRDCGAWHVQAAVGGTALTALRPDDVDIIFRVIEHAVGLARAPTLTGVPWPEPADDDLQATDAGGGMPWSGDSAEPDPMPSAAVFVLGNAAPAAAKPRRT